MSLELRNHFKKVPTQDQQILAEREWENPGKISKTAEKLIF